jgi:hypothetical protein
MLTYSIMAMVYLIVIGVRGEGIGLLLWPAVAVHAILIVLLGGAWLAQRRSPARWGCIHGLAFGVTYEECLNRI